MLTLHKNILGLSFFYLTAIVAVGCSPKTNSGLYTDSATSTDSARSFYLKIGEKTGPNEYRILFSAPNNISSLKFCPGTEECSDAESAQFIRTVGARSFFITSNSIEVSEGLSLRIEGFDRSYQVDRARAEIVVFNKFTDTPSNYLWQDHIKFVDIPSYEFGGNVYGSNYYKDVMSHVKNPYLNDSPLTIVHESHHFLLHEQDGKTAAADKFVYHEKGKGAHYPEPKTLTAEVERVFPKNVIDRGRLYNTYIKKRPSGTIGENILDEWQAYITETTALIEATEAGVYIKNDSVEGATLEFLYYNAAAMMVFNQSEPEHLEKENVKAVFAMLAEKSIWIYDKVKGNPELESSHSQFFYEQLALAPESDEIRKALIDIYGPVWTKRVLGF